MRTKNEEKRKPEFGREEEILALILCDLGFCAEAVDWSSSKHQNLYNGKKRFINVTTVGKKRGPFGWNHISYVLTGTKFSKWNDDCPAIRIDLAVPNSLDKLVERLKYCISRESRCGGCSNKAHK